MKLRVQLKEGLESGAIDLRRYMRCTGSLHSKFDRRTKMKLQQERERVTNAEDNEVMRDILVSVSSDQQAVPPPR